MSESECGCEIFELHDVISNDHEDPSVQAARKLDWASFCQSLSRLELVLVKCLVNRAKLGIVDANLLGCSQSMPRINEQWNDAILDLAEANHLIPAYPVEPANYSVPDVWGKARVRKAMSGFTDKVLERHKHTCIVCGTRLQGVFDAAHLSPYKSDVNNRAKGRLLAGMLQCCGQPCQKQPSTKSASRTFLKRKSGLPKIF